VSRLHWKKIVPESDEDEASIEPPKGEVAFDAPSTEQTAILSIRPYRSGGIQGMPTLRVVAGPELLRYLPFLPGDEVLVGREEPCDMILGDASVSRRHARVVSDERGSIFVEDLGSTNGTRINGVAITREELKPGDQLELGTVALRLDHMSSDEMAHLERIQAQLHAAGRDPLTGLKTRAWIEDELPAVAERYQASRMPFSIVFIDLDHFKGINDTFGHAVGDEVLRTAGRLMMLNVRDSDVCVRYGGEELLVFLPGSHRDRAAEIAERIRSSLEEHDWSRTVANLSVTASFGVAELEGYESVAAWMERADKALYAAKSGGRNRVRLSA